jgi:tetratricopeptide (TPR) repeat protein
MEDLDYEQAVAAYKTALEIEPNNLELINYISDTYIQWANELLENGNETDAIEKYKLALEINPDDLEAYKALLLIYAQNGDSAAFEELLAQAKKALSEDAVDEVYVSVLEKIQQSAISASDAGDYEGFVYYVGLMAKIDADDAYKVRDEEINKLLDKGDEQSCLNVLKIDSENENAYIKMIDASITEEDYEKAHELIEESECMTGGSTLIAEKHSEIPYVIDHDIKIENKINAQIDCPDYKFYTLDDEGKIKTYPGLTWKTGNNVLTLEEITIDHLGDGTKKITISASSRIEPTLYVDTDEKYYFNATLIAPKFFDYYTGLYYKSRGTYGSEEYNTATDIQWKGTTYTTYEAVNVKWDGWNWGEWFLEDDVWANTVSDCCHTCTEFIVPDDYDGIVLYLERIPEDFEYVEGDYFYKAESEEDMEAKAEKHFLDPSKNGECLNPDNYYFFRLTDEAIEDFNANR